MRAAFSQSSRAAALVFTALICACAMPAWSQKVTPTAPLNAHLSPNAGIIGVETEPHWSDWGYVTRFATAWASDAIAVYHQPLGAPADKVDVLTFCSVTTDGYATDPNEQGHPLQHAAVIAAYLHHKQVRLLVQGCAFNKPRIISVDVRN